MPRREQEEVLLMYPQYAKEVGIAKPLLVIPPTEPAPARPVTIAPRRVTITREIPPEQRDIQPPPTPPPPREPYMFDVRRADITPETYREAITPPPKLPERTPTQEFEAQLHIAETQARRGFKAQLREQYAGLPKHQREYRTRQEMKRFEREIGTWKTAQRQAYKTFIAEERVRWKKETVAGRIYTGDIPTLMLFPLFGIAGEAIGMVAPAPVREAKAGFVGTFESWIRPDIPTPIGAVIQQVKGEPTAYERGEVSPAYLFGGLVGVVTEVKATGFVIGKAWAGVQKIQKVGRFTAKASRAYRFSELAKDIHKTRLAFKEALPAWRGSRLDVFLAKHSKWYYRTTKGIAKGEVALKYLPERVGITQLQAGQVAWSLAGAPRTGGVIIRQFPAVTKGPQRYVMELVTRGTQVFRWIRPMREEELIKAPAYRPLPERLGYTKGWFKKDVLPMFEHRGLLPFVTQTQLTRMGIHPYIPRKLGVATGKKAMQALGIGVGVTPLFKQLQREPAKPKRALKPPRILPLDWQPTFAYERERFKPFVAERPIQKERELEIAVPRIAKIGKQYQVPAFTPPSPPPMPTPRGWPPLLFPRRGGRGIARRTDKELFGKWFKRRHAVPTPKELFERVMPTAKRAKKRKDWRSLWL